MTTKYIKYTTTSTNGIKLVSTYKLSASGLWQLKGEVKGRSYADQPDLGMVRGLLEDVVKYAVDLSRFWNLGQGGTITLVY